MFMNFGGIGGKCEQCKINNFFSITALKVIELKGENERSKN